MLILINLLFPFTKYCLNYPHTKLTKMMQARTRTLYVLGKFEYIYARNHKHMLHIRWRLDVCG